MEEDMKNEIRAIKGSDAVENIGAETRWKMATRGLTGAYVATVNAMLQIAGREKYNPIMAKIWTEAGKTSKQIADILSLDVHDTASAVEAARLVSIGSMGPEFVFEIIETTAEKTTFRYHECQWWNRMKELKVADDLCSHACPAYWNAAVRSFNPKLTASLAKAKPWGDPYCEHVCELEA